MVHLIYKCILQESGAGSDTLQSTVRGKMETVALFQNAAAAAKMDMNRWFLIIRK